MGFSEAVKSVYSKYVTFSGRAARSEYWFFQLFFILVAFVILGLTFAMVGMSGFEQMERTGQFSVMGSIMLGLLGIFYLASLLPMISVTVRRLHDRNMSGWWLLGLIVASAIPIVGFLASIAWFVLMVLKGTDGPNRFGNDPLRGQMSSEVFS